MKDKTSFSNNQKQISKDLQDYINSLVEEVVLNNKDFDNQEKYLLRYAKTENIEAEELVDALGLFFFLIERYNQNQSIELKERIEKQASKCYIKGDVLNNIFSLKIDNLNKNSKKEETKAFSFDNNIMMLK